MQQKGALQKHSKQLKNKRNKLTLKISKIMTTFHINSKSIQNIKSQFFLNPSCNVDAPSSNNILKYTYKLRKTIQAPNSYRTTTSFLPLRFQSNSLHLDQFVRSRLRQTNRSNKHYKYCEIPTISYVNNSQKNLNKLTQISETESKRLNDSPS